MKQAHLRFACGFFVIILTIDPAFGEPDCGWEHHFQQLDGRWEQWCLSSYSRRVVQEQTIGNVITGRSQARPDANLKAVCMFPIPCNYENDVRDAAYEIATDWKVSVCGSVSIGLKESLSIKLLEVLGLESEIDLDVTLEGCAEYTRHEGYSDTLHIHQQDCHDVLYKFWKTTRRVRGTATEVEEYEWELHNIGFFDPNGQWHECHGGTIVTRCDGSSALGTARNISESEIENFITPCCSPLDGDPPCCSRECYP